MKTADGQPFIFQSWKIYYCLIQPIFGIPQLQKIEILSDSRLEFSRYDINQVELVIVENNIHKHYILHELYLSKIEANKALLKAREEFLIEFTANNEEMRKKIKSGISDP